MKKQFIWILILIWSIIGCKKQEQIVYQETDAMVLNSGKIASGGCGWLIKIDHTDAVFSPINLPELLKIDSLKVTISYSLLNTKFNCNTGSSFTQIQLKSIRKKDAIRPD